MKKLLHLTGLLWICSGINAYAEEQLSHYTGSHLLTYERITVSDHEKLDLVGLEKSFDFGNYLYGGVTVYSAVKGERGGFFTVGMNGGLKYPVTDSVTIKGGLFAGAGGGGSAPQGGGLMLRPYTELSYSFKNFSLGAGVSHISFPNGDISSTQAFASVSLPTEGSYLSGLHFHSDTIVPSTRSQETETSKYTLSFLYEHYAPFDSAVNTDGNTHTGSFSLMGLELEKMFTSSLYGFLQAAGAGKGGHDGYMELFSGIGYRYSFGQTPLYIAMEAALGAGGGGRVDTGGGFLYRAQGLAGFKLPHDFSLAAYYGFVDAPTGSFRANSYGLTLSYETTIVDALSPTEQLEGYTLLPWRFNLLHKSYLHDEYLFKESKREGRVDLIGFSLSHFITEHIYLGGATYWAYNGDSGGYAEGFFHLGAESTHRHNLSLFAEAAVGVGGGGGLNVGGGLLGSAEIGARYHFSDAASLSLSAAYIRGSNGDFSTSAIKGALSYDFSLLSR